MMQRNPRELARTTDPDTSHAAARTISTSSQCWQLLRARLIEWAIDADGNPIHRPGPNGRNLRVSVISDLGWQVFRAGTARRGA